MNVLIENYKGYCLRAWGHVVAGSSVVVPCFEVYSLAEERAGQLLQVPSRLLCWLELAPVAGTQMAVTFAYEAAQEWIDRHLPSPAT